MPDGSYVPARPTAPSGTADLAAALTAARLPRVRRDHRLARLDPHLEAASSATASLAGNTHDPSPWNRTPDDFIRTLHPRPAAPTHLISSGAPRQSRQRPLPQHARRTVLDDMIHGLRPLSSPQPEKPEPPPTPIGDGGNEMGMGTDRDVKFAQVVPHRRTYLHRRSSRPDAGKRRFQLVGLGHCLPALPGIRTESSPL